MVGTSAILMGGFGTWAWDCSLSPQRNRNAHFPVIGARPARLYCSTTNYDNSQSIRYPSMTTPSKCCVGRQDCHNASEHSRHAAEDLKVYLQFNTFRMTTAYLRDRSRWTKFAPGLAGWRLEQASRQAEHCHYSNKDMGNRQWFGVCILHSAHHRHCSRVFSSLLPTWNFFACYW